MSNMIHNIRASSFEKVADASNINPLIAARWKKIEDLTRNNGVYVGTDHKRIVVPKEKLTEEDVKNIGFKTSFVAVPESGQDSFITYRHPDNNFHIHSHDDVWTIHEDRHPSSQMLALKAVGLKNKGTAFASGLPHLATEGIPGMFTYIKGLFNSSISTADNVADDLDNSVKRNINRWKSYAGV